MIVGPRSLISRCIVRSALAGSALVAFVVGAGGCSRSTEPDGPLLPPLGLLKQEQRIALAERAITRLDVDQASELLDGTQGPRAARTKARLAIYRADCEGALAHLATEAARREEGALELLSLADRCQGATVGAVIVEDQARGVWLRFQDSADEVLAPFLIEVIDSARAAIGEHLRVDLPRPLRLDLVRDLFSLSAVSGLPVEAAETTGTVAVARWGRVTMLSPRAMTSGYPWADTLAHELTHLMLSRATLDRAPLWLQEGIAKREEELWREERPFDRSPDPRIVAAEAQANGQAVGVTRLGPSIAMLPTADAAAIAFAEVSSFMGYWIEQNGPRALPLLLSDMAFSKDADSAMRSVSGLSVEDWELLYRAELAKVGAEDRGPEEAAASSPGALRDLGRRMRLIELLSLRSHFGEAVGLSQPAVDGAPHVAALRFLAQRAFLRSEQEDASGSPRAGGLLGEISDLSAPHGGWLALDARRVAPGQSSEKGRELLSFAQALDPLLPEVACGGGLFQGDPQAVELSVAERRLCEHVLKLPPRGER